MKTKEKRTTTNFVKRVRDEGQEEQEKINFNLIQTTLYKELNNLRQDPKSYIPLIQEQMNSLKKIIFSRKKTRICKFKL